MHDGVQPVSGRGAQGLEARAAALDVLLAVVERKQPLDLALEQVLGRCDSLSDSRDRGFVRMLTGTALRRYGQISDLLRRAKKDPDQSLPPEVACILVCGVTQLLFMDVPDHAAVDVSVRLARARGFDRHAGFVNAVLRRIGREEGQAWRAAQDPVRLCVPDWLFALWVADYGQAQALRIAEASLREAPLDLTLCGPLARRGGDQDLFPDGVRLPGGSVRLPDGAGAVSRLPEFENGQWFVQDAASALPVRLFGDVAGQTVYDLCAAPGGKTAQLAAAGAQVVALDRSAARLRRLEDNLQRLGFEDRVRVCVQDAQSWVPQTSARFVLLDAPCSATGTIRRHPDLLLHKSAADIARLCAIQARLLRHAAQHVAPGGCLVYCTCSLQKVEGEAQIDSFLAEHPEFSRRPVDPAEIGGTEDLVTLQGDLRTLPSHLPDLGGLDGFFAARLVRG